VCRNVDVTIVRIESINSARWERAIRHVAMRRLLAAGIRVDMSVNESGVETATSDEGVATASTGDVDE